MHKEYSPHNRKNPKTKGAIFLGPSGNLQSGFKFMALNTVNKIVRRSCDVIPMADTVITRINALGSNQPEQLIFTDRRGCLIGDFEITEVDPYDADHIDIPGVDASDIGVDNIDIPGVDVDIQDPQVIEIIDPNIPPTDPAHIESETVHQADSAVDPMPFIQQMEPGLHRYSRVRTQTENYTPGISGSK